MSNQTKFSVKKFKVKNFFGLALSPQSPIIPSSDPNSIITIETQVQLVTVDGTQIVTIS